tara:strand:+ start:93 stop:1289 length:1197 start_codon:yes stop_codon:yes gene_type:complete
MVDLVGKKQVKTPRFYVDIPTFLHATGDLHWGSSVESVNTVNGSELLYMNCANPSFRPANDDIHTDGYLFNVGKWSEQIKTAFPINFCGLLNHNFGSASGPIHAGYFSGINYPNDYTGGRLHHLAGHENVINTRTPSSYSAGIDPQYNGTSIWTFTEINDYWRGFFITAYKNNTASSKGIPDADLDLKHQLGSFVVGKYFDCPNSPDLNVTMSRRFDGIKKQKTIGGKQLANIYYDGPTEWTMNRKNADFGRDATYKYPPFELDTTANVDSEGYRFDFRAKSGLGRKGLRSWDLTFSYISESDMWINSEVSNKVINDKVEDGESPTTGIDANPMLSDNSFNFVYNCTLGGALPFIFTDDKDSNAPDRYSICTFKDKSFSVDQVAPATYSVSVTIDELA